MAQSGGGIFTWVLIGGAAYLAYTWFTAPAAGAAPAGGSGGSGGTAPACPSPGVLTNNVCTCPAPNTMVSGVCTAPPAAPATIIYAGPADTSAAGIALATNLVTQVGSLTAGPFNIDQWNYYYAQIPGTMPITGTQLNSMLATAGAAGANRSAVVMTASQYVALLSSAGVAGLSGYQGYVRAIPVPNMYARGFGHFTLGDFRRAGGR